MSGVHFSFDLVLNIWFSSFGGWFQALTNQILSDVRSRARVLHYLFVNVLPY